MQIAKPKFYVGQSVVVLMGQKIEMYSIDKADYDNGKWTYYSINGPEVTYLHEDNIIFYYQNGNWQSDSHSSRIA